MKNWTPKQKKTFFTLALFVAVLDQLVKLIILDTFLDGQVKEIIPGFFNLLLTYNPGVAFGIFANIDQDIVRYSVLGATTLLALAAVYWFASGEIGESKTGRIALALVVGGAVGNLADRIRLGKVVDYLDFYYGTYHWPAFNIADTSICIAMALLIFTSFGSKNPG